MESMRILLVDDQPEVRSALRLILEQEDEFQVVGEAADARDMLFQLFEKDADLVLVDWELPGSKNGKSGAKTGAVSQAIALLRTVDPKLKIMALSGRPEARSEAASAQVDLFVSKCDPPEILLSAVRDCM